MTKSVKAWAVVNKDGELRTYCDEYEIGNKRDELLVLVELGERVVPVTIIVEEK